MENMTKESKLSFTSNPATSDSPEGFYGRCVSVKEEQGMTELERKFIMMSRIAVVMHKKGMIATVALHVGFASISLQDPNNGYEIIENFYDHEITEQELLDWWSAIEG
ncbi:hypothetical protein VPHK435_0082 [Vibrio phage K435]